MKCGLLGQKLGHSYSPQIHSFFGDYSYELYERQPEELKDFLEYGDYRGLNVTIPYKKEVMAYCSELSDLAHRLGAVNTVIRENDGMRIGYNTDYYGFSELVRRSGLDPAGKKVLVLGSGGASCTAVAVMKEKGADVIVISRNGINNYGNLFLHRDAAMIINATPVGMYPKTLLSPVDISMFPNLEGVLDMIYNPARTKLLLDAAQRGLITENGLWMLVAQAKKSAEYFTGQKIPDSMMPLVYNKLRLQMENIVLIGMPGCGKSYIGRALSEALKKPFVDTDHILESRADRSIAEIFQQEGEDGFRRRESEILEEIGKQSGCIVATGGGCVTRDRNYAFLKQNGILIWLKRDIHHLPTDGRPLSASIGPEELYQLRKPLYQRFADCTVDNHSDPAQTIKMILNLLEEKYENSCC